MGCENLVWIAAILKLASGCIPMNPDQDTPCTADIEMTADPSAPGIQYMSATQSSNGNMYSCPAGYSFIEQDGTTINGPFKDSTVFCDVVSGKWKIDKPNNGGISEEKFKIGCGMMSAFITNSTTIACAAACPMTEPTNRVCIGSMRYCDDSNLVPVGNPPSPGSSYTCSGTWTLMLDGATPKDQPIGAVLKCGADGKWSTPAHTSTLNPFKISCSKKN